MRTKTNIIVRFQIEGMHYWESARDVFPEVGFLSDSHRHMFHFDVVKKVNHDDRDVEFIMFKRDVEQYLKEKYWMPARRCLNFGKMSCEMIAKEILEKFDCERVLVFEDGENGAEIVKY